MLPDIDLALSVGTTTLLLLLAALLFRDYSAVVAGRLAAAFALGAAAHALTATTGFATAGHAGACGFDCDCDRKRRRVLAVCKGAIRRRLQAARLACPALGRGCRLSLITCLVLVPRQILDRRNTRGRNGRDCLGFVALAIGQTVTSWPADLVEDRRRLRIFVVVVTAVYASFNAVFQILLPGNDASGIVPTADAAILAAVVIAIACALLRVGGETIFFAAAEAPRPAAANSNEANPADRKLLEALMRLMAEERIYRHEGISIGTLATKLSVPEYRLRRLINQQLGYRNFNVFLNDHRIEEAKAALADPSQAEVPVITIAMDAGFQSLGPFNRAFKATTGVTPTEYRRLNEVRA